MYSFVLFKGANFYWICFIYLLVVSLELFFFLSLCQVMHPLYEVCNLALTDMLC